MATLADIRERIRSTKSTHKITGAMKLVAVSKLRRAQEAIVQARPYANALSGLLKRVSARTSEDGDMVEHPFLGRRPIRRALLLVMTSDRGLCGGFNTQIIRAAEQFLRDNRSRYDEIEIGTIGRKGYEYFRKKEQKPVQHFQGVFERLSYERAEEIGLGMAQAFAERKLDAVFLLYNAFHSSISQKVSIDQMLPIDPAELPDAGGVDYLYEPEREVLLDTLIRQYVAVGVWRALLESSASEHGARMSAMDAATKNAKELIGTLTLQYNRARQQAITRELMDIVGGAEALQS